MIFESKVKVKYILLCCLASGIPLGLDPDQDRRYVRYVGLDLGPNCLQRLSDDDKSR